MGCAPSIHVSQSTGVVYCRDDSTITDSSNLQPVHVSKKLSATSLSISEAVNHIPAVGHKESLTTEVRIIRYQGSRQNSLIATTTQAWVTSAQTNVISQGMDKVPIVYIQ